MFIIKRYLQCLCAYCFFSFRKARKTLAQKLLISLSLSLMALIIVFLAGVDRTSSRLGCQCIAAILHYLILTTFSWTAVEAFSLYRKFVNILKRYDESKFFFRASLIAWG